MWRGSSREGGDGVSTYINMYIYIYTYIHTHTHIYSTPNDPAPLNKQLQNTVFLSNTPTFVYLLGKGQHAS